MARDHATVNYGMTNDPDYRALPVLAQHLYLTLWVAPGMSWCGVRDWRPGRISGLTDDLSPDLVVAAGDCLRARRFIVTDDDTEEVLIRSWVRFDGLMKQPRLAVSFVTAYATVASETLREVIVHEARKLRDLEPEFRCWSDDRVKEVLDHPAKSARDLPTVSDPFGDGFRGGFGFGLAQTLPSVSGSVSVPPTPSPTPSPTPCSNPFAEEVPDEGAATPPKSKRKKPSGPLADDWVPTDEHLARCVALGVDPATELAKFRAHAEANDRRQVNWNAAFTQWLLNARPGNVRRLPGAPDPDAWMARRPQ